MTRVKSGERRVNRLVTAFDQSDRRRGEPGA